MNHYICRTCGKDFGASFSTLPDLCTQCNTPTIYCVETNIPSIPNPPPPPPKKENPTPIFQCKACGWKPGKVPIERLPEACPGCGKLYPEYIEQNGVKHDQAKPRWDLLPMRETEEVVHVLTFGSTKYDDNNWKIVDNSRNRYFAALMRHVTAWWGGEPFDPETHRHHLAHAVCCCLFLMWFDLEKKK